MFPAAGNRNNNNGTAINNVTSNGYCWTSSANSTTNARNLNLNSSNFNWNNNNRAYGFSVRPVAEITTSGKKVTPFSRLPFLDKNEADGTNDSQRPE